MKFFLKPFTKYICCDIIKTANNKEVTQMNKAELITKMAQERGSRLRG